MRQLGNLSILVIISILFLIKDTSGLTCWRCSSDASNSKFCGETLDLSEISVQQKRWNYVECDTKPPQGSVDKIEGLNVDNLIPKCRVLLQMVNDKPTYTRSCYWEQENVPPNSCTIQSYNPSYVKTIACYTCVGDGCNHELIIPKEKDNLVISTESPINSAPLAVLSHTILAMLITLSVVMWY